MQLAVEVILSHSVMLVLIPVGVFVGISRVEVLESVVGLTDTFLTITLYSNGSGLFFGKILHCNLNPLSANFTFFSINDVPFISILVLNSGRKISEHKVALQYAIGVFPPLG